MAWYLDKNWYGLDGTKIHYAVLDLCNALVERMNALGVPPSAWYVNTDRSSSSFTLGIKSGSLDILDLTGMELRYLAYNVYGVHTGIYNMLPTGASMIGSPNTFVKSGSHTGANSSDYWTDSSLDAASPARPANFLPSLCHLFEMAEFMVWLAERLEKLVYYPVWFDVEAVQDYNEPGSYYEAPGASCSINTSPEDARFDFPKTFRLPHYYETWNFTCPYSWCFSASDSWDLISNPLRSPAAVYIPGLDNAVTSQVVPTMRTFSWYYSTPPLPYGPVYKKVHYYAKGNEKIRFKLTPSKVNPIGTAHKAYSSFSALHAGIGSASFKFLGEDLTLTFTNPRYVFSTPSGPSVNYENFEYEMDPASFQLDQAEFEAFLEMPQPLDNPFSGYYNYGWQYIYRIDNPAVLYWSASLSATGIGNLRISPKNYGHRVIMNGGFEHA